MKKRIFLIFFTLGLLSQAFTAERVIVKIGRNMTIYDLESPDSSDFWKEGVIITKTEISLPSDGEMKKLKLPDEDWLSFKESVNGIYSSREEKLEKMETAKNLTILFLVIVIILILILKKRKNDQI